MKLTTMQNIARDRTSGKFTVSETYDFGFKYCIGNDARTEFAKAIKREGYT